MGEYILKVLTDALFYLAIFMPVIQAGPLPVRLLLALLPVCWAVWVKLNWKQRNFMESLQDHFFFQIRLLFVLSPVELFILGLETWSRVNGPLVVLFAAVGILAMKTGRITRGSQRKGVFWVVCGLEIAAVLAAVLVLSSDVFVKGILSLLGNGYKMLILPVLLLIISGISKVLEWIWPYVMQIFSRHDVRLQSQESFTISGDLDVELEQAERIAGAEFLRIFGVVAAAAAVLLFLWYLWRRFSKAGTAGQKMEGTVSRSGLSPQEFQEEKRGFFGGERNVRYYYRKFMMLCKKKDGWGKGMVTTSHIHNLAQEYWEDEESLTSLRDLYREVRYGGRDDGSAERRRAKAIYRKLKDTRKEKQQD